LTWLASSLNFLEFVPQTLRSKAGGLPNFSWSEAKVVFEEKKEFSTKVLADGTRRPVKNSTVG